MLIPYYANYKTTLKWYQDIELCKQVDNREEPYDPERLKRMYSYLDNHGYLFYIKYRNRLCGDVSLQDDGQINIVIARAYQNKHIGRRVIHAIIRVAYAKHMPVLYANIYTFNDQSRKMFESVGFLKTLDYYQTETDRFVLELDSTTSVL